MNPMSDIKVPVEVDPNEDTEWNDILRAHGIIPEKPPSPTEELENALEEAIKRQHDNRLDNKDIDELDELEDEEDEEFLNFYKQKRMNEMKNLQSKMKFGQVVSITKSEYEKEVTNDSSNQAVILHMSSDAALQSRLLSVIFRQLALKFADIKFVDIPAARCIENYPTSNIPTILIYKNKDVLKQFITLTELGGNDTKIIDLEKALVRYKIIDDSDKRLLMNQDNYEEANNSSRKFTKIIRNDDDDDFYD